MLLIQVKMYEDYNILYEDYNIYIDRININY